jgi:hypothetical protein
MGAARAAGKTVHQIAARIEAHGRKTTLTRERLGGGQTLLASQARQLRKALRS